MTLSPLFTECLASLKSTTRNYCKTFFNLLTHPSNYFNNPRANNSSLSSASSSSSSHSSKKGKGGHHRNQQQTSDQNIESVISHFGTSPPILPHNEFLDEFIQKIRKRLKFSDEENYVRFSRSELQNKVFVTSSTTSSGSGTTNQAISLRSVINTILLETDILEGLKAKQSFSCSYLSEIKSQVHGPLSSLLNKFTQLPSLDDTGDLTSSSQQFHSVETAYNNLRGLPLFQQISIQKQEAEFIESEVNEMLKPLRQAAKTITKLSNVRRESVWSRILLPLLACPTGEVMARCCHQ
jgi:hypothetical protein